ncbi:MAG: hypothetical protein M5U19_04385 [Microthrixaceae bacterium]|nr:hypothetical protein [Microthrixaceae bacterium]
MTKVSARASYETEGGRFTIETGGDSSRLKVGGCNMAARQTRGELRQWANEGVGASSPLVLYDGATRNCITSPGSGAYKDGFRSHLAALEAERPVELLVLRRWWVLRDHRLVQLRPGGPARGHRARCGDPPDRYDVVGLRHLHSGADPQSGCITAHPNYDGGQGPDYTNLAKIEYQNPDCALVRADSYTADGSDATDGGLCLGPCPGRRTNWFGRVSVKGTIYAPSAAVEIDDNDIGYPLATRGVILRHLRISGAKPRANFTEPLFGNQLDKEPNPRVAKLTACIQADVNPGSPRPCDPDTDRVVARSGVRFAADPTEPNPTAADVPEVLWYTDATTEWS